MTYTNELEVEVDFSDVDPNLIEDAPETDYTSTALVSSDEKLKKENIKRDDFGDSQSKVILGGDEPKPTMAGRASRFFRKKS
jgi:hypothetical protein